MLVLTLGKSLSLLLVRYCEYSVFIKNNIKNMNSPRQVLLLSDYKKTRQQFSRQLANKVRFAQFCNKIKRLASINQHYNL